MNHRQKICHIEGIPTDWLARSSFFGQPGGTGANGPKSQPAVRLQCACGREILRMRLDENAPWSEQLVLIVRNGKVEVPVLFDWARAEKPDAAVQVLVVRCE